MNVIMFTASAVWLLLLLAAPVQGQNAGWDLYAEGVQKYNGGEMTDAIRLFRQAANDGVAEAQLILGQLYLEGRGVEKNAAEAVMWLRNAADNGSGEAMFILGTMYDSGNGVGRSLPDAISWYEKGAAADNRNSAFNLGILYYYGEEPIEQNYRRAAEWFRKSAEMHYNTGNLEFKVATLYYDMPPGDDNNLSAALWFYYAAKDSSLGQQTEDELHHLGDMGVSEAWYLLGREYRKYPARKGWNSDDFTVYDNFEAEEYWLVAARQGHVVAQRELGRLYREQDKDAEAFRWYLSAAQAGDTGAQYNLGHIYRNGHGTQQDLNLARQWMKRAWEQDYGTAGHQLWTWDRERYGPNYHPGWVNVAKSTDGKMTAWVNTHSISREYHPSYRYALTRYDYSQEIERSDGKIVDGYKQDMFFNCSGRSTLAMTTTWYHHGSIVPTINRWNGREAKWQEVNSSLDGTFERENSNTLGEAILERVCR